MAVFAWESSAFYALGIFGLIAATSAMASGKSAPLEMLNRIQPGLWELRDHGSTNRQTICIQTGRSFIQLRHPKNQCSSLILEDSPQAITVQYSCRATGNGRTRIRFERPTLVQIESQGIHSGLPFEIHAEARRLGDCGR